MKPGLVSIIIPYFNHKKYIKELLDSIKNQSYKNIEIILINDGSSDGSLDYLKSLKFKYNFKLISQRNHGICFTLNRAIKLSKGEFIKPIGSDDMLSENSIKNQVNYFSNKKIDAVAGGITLIKEDSTKLNYLKPRKIGRIYFEDAINNNPIYSASLMLRALVYKKYGLYDELNPIEDFPYLLKILDKGAVVENVDENFAYYRVSEKNYINKAKWYLEGVLCALLEYKTHPLINNAIKYHLNFFDLKSAIFKESHNYEINKRILYVHNSFFENLKRSLLIYLILFLPTFIRKIIQKKIIYKSNKIISLTHFFK